MPITKSALKKQRVDKKRTQRNIPVLGRVKSTLKAVRVKVDAEAIKNLQQALDKAAKKRLIPKRRAARLKSRAVAAAKKSKKS
jgi:ribosomal protein S20